MDVNLKLFNRVDDMSALSSLLDWLIPTPHRAGLDVETTGLDCRSKRIRLVQFGMLNGDAYVVDCFALPNFLKLLAEKLAKHRPSTSDRHPEESAATFAFHNGSFDVKFLWAAGVDVSFYAVADSLIGSKVYKCGLPVMKGYHKLDAVAERWINEDFSKELQVSDWGAKELSEEQIKYAAVDPVATARTSLAIEEKLKQMDLWNTYKLECHALLPTAVMEYNGVLCDIERLNAMRPHYENIIKTSEYKFKEHLPLYTRRDLGKNLVYSGLNMGSSAQVLRALTYCGVPEPEDMLTEDDLDEDEDEVVGVRSTGSKHLSLLDLDDYPVLEPLMDFRAANKLVTSYFNSLPGLVNPITGRIHPSYNQMVSTGRYSCSAPNLQQVPRPGKDKTVAIRHAFKAPDDYHIVQADYSQIELRVMALVANDEEMIREFKEGKDPYAATAALMCGVDYEAFVQFDKDTYKSKRQSAKPVKLGFQYGMSARKFKLYARQSYKVKFTANECNAYRKKFFEKYWGLAAYHKKLNQDRTLASMRTLSPVRRMRKWEEYPGVPGLSNAPVQGTSGDITKLALWKIYKELWINGYHPCQSEDVKLILTVHDEIELEAKNGLEEWSKELLQRNMEDAGNYILRGKVPVEAEACIVQTLAEK